jgi:hypothetical protein
LRKYAFVFAAVAAAFIVFPASSYAQGGRCEELRLACEHKGALGEQGQGNCKEYRATCQRRVSWVQTCQQLRYACLHKDTLGLEGQGTCERYRETCRR